MAAINKVILLGRLREPPARLAEEGHFSPPRSLYRITFESPGNSSALSSLVLAVTFEVAHSLQTSQAQDFLYLEGRLSDCDEGPAAASVIAEDVVVMKRPECRAGEGDSLERKAGYSGSIRWQAFRDPRWEIETRHPGFNSPEDAALYTAGFGHAAVEELELLDAGLHLRLTDGTALQVSDSDVRVWHAAVPVEGFRPETADFQQIPITAAQLARVLAPTPFVPLLYDVIGPTAERMPFSIQAPSRNELKLTVYDALAEDTTRSKTTN